MATFKIILIDSVDIQAPLEEDDDNTADEPIQEE